MVLLCVAGDLAAQAPVQTVSPGVAATGVGSTAEFLIERALRVFEQTTNFAAGVDIDSVDRHGANPVLTRAKETWHFSRVKGTNTIVRKRYLPFAGKEIIESEKYAGGRLLAEKTVPLPESLSLPGFEICNLLQEMVAAGPVIEKVEAGSVLFVATLPSGTRLRALFPARAVMPQRVERWQGQALVSAITRSTTGTDDRVLPAHDTLISYEGGRLATTVSRSYANAEEASAKSSQTNLIQVNQSKP
jgi:hypothetical protein